MIKVTNELIDGLDVTNQTLFGARYGKRSASKSNHRFEIHMMKNNFHELFHTPQNN